MTPIEQPPALSTRPIAGVRRALRAFAGANDAGAQNDADRAAAGAQQLHTRLVRRGVVPKPLLGNQLPNRATRTTSGSDSALYG
jgi:hypothetical protein